MLPPESQRDKCYSTETVHLADQMSHCHVWTRAIKLVVLSSHPFPTLPEALETFLFHKFIQHFLNVIVESSFTSQCIPIWNKQQLLCLLRVFIDHLIMLTFPARDLFSLLCQNPAWFWISLLNLLCLKESNQFFLLIHTHKVLYSWNHSDKLILQFLSTSHFS